MRADWRETRNPCTEVLDITAPGPHSGRAKHLEHHVRYALPTLTFTGPGGRFVVAGFGYDDCPGHPVWLPPRESGPLWLIANQPRTRLHSQLDGGDALRPGVVQLPTGAWFDPVEDHPTGPLCAHGNPNVLTADVPSSRLSQGCAGQHAAVEVERFEGPVPEATALRPPRFTPR
ncbi:hypothetical protein [Amycolatopsis sp. cmx-8-4]|uniref:hypothetical protein n=1 Tax=Amycolatopsis sp. cmx-8-4 TaxID=2790947 RepID=UPI00397A6D56